MGRLSLPSRFHLAFAAPSKANSHLPKPTLPDFSRTNLSFLEMDSHPRVCSVSCPSSTTTNRSPSAGSVKRVTRETNVSAKINLDGTRIVDSTTGIPFLDHMLDKLASHGLFKVHVRATVDLHIDDHHTNEDVILAIGTALLQACGDRKGIHRFGDFSAPLDEALIHVALADRISALICNCLLKGLEHMILGNTHHIIEATLKAFARALQQAT